MNFFSVLNAVEYNLVEMILNMFSLLMVFVYRWAPIVISLFIARTVWLIYKLERNKENEKKDN